MCWNSCWCTFKVSCSCFFGLPTSASFNYVLAWLYILAYKDVWMLKWSCHLFCFLSSTVFSCADVTVVVNLQIHTGTDWTGRVSASSKMSAVLLWVVDKWLCLWTNEYTNEEFLYSRMPNSDLLREQRLNLWPFIKVRVQHTHRFVHLFIKQSDKAAKNIVGAAFGPLEFFAPTRLSHCRSPFLQFWVE